MTDKNSVNQMTRAALKAAILEHEIAEFGPDALSGQMIDKMLNSRLCLNLWFSVKNVLLAYGFVTKRRGNIYRLERLCVTEEGRFQDRLGTYLHKALIDHEVTSVFQCYVPERSVREQYWMKAHGWIAVGIAKDYYHSGDAIEFLRTGYETIHDQDQSVS